MLFKVETSVNGLKQILKLNGILDFSTVDHFNFIEIIDESIREIEVDFTELEFLDSTGIGAIISILHIAASRNANVEFSGMSAEIIHLFNTIGLFEIKNSLLDGNDFYV